LRLDFLQPRAAVAASPLCPGVVLFGFFFCVCCFGVCGLVVGGVVWGWCGVCWWLVGGGGLLCLFVVVVCCGVVGVLFCCFWWFVVLGSVR